MRGFVMKLLAAVVSAFCLCLMAHAGAAEPGSPPKEEFLSFDKFAKATAEAKYADFNDRKGVKVKSEADFHAMKAHLLELYDGVTPTHTYVAADGQYIDCIPFAQQPGLRNAPASAKVMPTPPPAPAPAPGVVPPPGRAGIPVQPGESGGKDAFGNERSCPAGSIPMPRVTLDKMTQSPTLDDFLGRTTKKGPPIP
jgi:hypothetical protein